MVPLQSVQLILPQIVARLEYSVVKTNLHIVVPNISGTVMLLILAFAHEVEVPFRGAGLSIHVPGYDCLCGH